MGRLDQTKRVRLGEQLIRMGVLTEAQLDRALQEQQLRQMKLGETLLSMGYVSERHVAEALTEQWNIEYAELQNMVLDESAVYLIDEVIAKQYRLIPIGYEKGDPNCLRVAMADPMDFKAIDDITIITGRKIIPLFSTNRQIAYQIDYYFGKQSVLAVADQYKREQKQSGADTDFKLMGDESDAAAGHSPIVVMVRSIIEQAVRRRASDIHFEPMKEGIRIRFRIDGDLMETMTYDRSIYTAIIARLKVISGMDISEKRKPQDGRMTMHIDHVEYDVRVSALPTVHGEKVVMRLADKERLTRDKSELGLSAEDLKKFDRMLAYPHGLILVTGPTGSGKSTTLYTALSELNRESVNIVTVEDPVEADLEGVSQIQVNPKAELTFASALRSILRQDPDIIMIGEIRDSETAQIAVQASITGHLVVSTLHTNTTWASIARLLNMGVEPYLIADALVGVVAQRLLRRLCVCKRGREATVLEKEELGIKKEQPFTVYEPAGCQLCSYTGYYGRIGVYEMMPMSPALRWATVKMQPSSKLKEIAISEGMMTLQASAARLVMAGVTSLSQMRKLTYEAE